MNIAFVGNPLVELIDDLPLFSSDFAFITHKDNRKLVLVLKVSEEIVQCGHSARAIPSYEEESQSLTIRFECDEPAAVCEVALPLLDADCREALMQAALHEDQVRVYVVSEHAAQILPRPLFRSEHERAQLRDELFKARIGH